MSKLGLLTTTASLLLTACAGSSVATRPEVAATLHPVAFERYTMADLRTARTPRGPGYAFIVARASDATPEWAVNLSGGVGASNLRVAVSEYAELKPAKKTLDPFTLHLTSSESSRIVGTLKSASATYRIDGAPRGALPLGHDFGLAALAFYQDDRPVAVIDVSGDRLEASLAADLDPSAESLFVGVALVVGLTHRALDQTGARFMWREDVGLSDFTCVTASCDTLINRRGQEVGVEPSLMQVVHKGQIAE